MLSELFDDRSGVRAEAADSDLAGCGTVWPVEQCCIAGLFGRVQRGTLKGTVF